MLAPVRILSVYMFNRLTLRMNSPYFTKSVAVLDTCVTKTMVKSVNKGGIRRLRSSMAQGLRSEDGPPKVKAEVHEQSISVAPLQTHADTPAGEANYTGENTIIYKYVMSYHFLSFYI